MYEIYTIQPGDTIDTIAQKLNIGPELIYQLNDLPEGMNLSIGENIVVPKNNNVFSYYTIKKGDNLYQIAKDYDINYNVLAKINGLKPNDYIYPGQIIIVPNRNIIMYVTDEEDTIESISQELAIDIPTLLTDNPNIQLKADQIIIKRKK